ncbi:MAG: amylo-alpha-1,6-glucosidase [Candidatus Bipolaricaulia bacterium]
MEIVQLVPIRDGREIESKVQADAVSLRWEDDEDRWIELCFDGPQSLRLQGQGLGLRVKSVQWTVAYRPDERLVTFNILGAMRRYQFECISGQIKLHGPWKAGQQDEKQVQIDLISGDDGHWETAVDEFWSTWIPRSRRDFDACLSATRSDFEKWLAGIPDVPSEFTDARTLAAYINWSFTVAPEGLLHRPSMLMSKNWMNNVWSWDHCFNAMALVQSHSDLAWDQMLLMVDHQDEYGAYPDVVNDVFKQYNFSKPPVHGWTVLELWRQNPDAASKERLEIIYGSLERWTRWWLEHRRLPGQALPHYLHGNDSGWDNSTMFDEGVPLIAPDLAAFLIVQMDALSALAEHLGRASEAPIWQHEADQLLDALLNQLWKEDHFIAKLAVDGREVESDSLIPCMPILLGKRLPATVSAKLAENIERFLTEYGLATEHPNSPAYTSDGYWRGPIWAPSTYIVVCGLEQSGYRKLARRISERFCALCARSGFAENYDALTGAARRDPGYTWTASVFLLLAERLRGQLGA